MTNFTLIERISSLALKQHLKWLASVLLMAVIGTTEGGAQEVAPVSKFSLRPLALPGANGLVMLDYFAYDRKMNRLWVPAGNTASVDVIDGTTDQITRIAGFSVAPFAIKGKQRMLGPSSVTLGERVVYVGNRGDATICSIDAATLRKVDCLRTASPSEGLAAAPDGLAYVAATKELWVTTGAPPVGIPAADRSIKVYDASIPGHLKLSATIPLSGSAEGYAVDNHRGQFYTNVEESGDTLAIDIRRHSIVSTWRSGCDEPHGMAVDTDRGLLFVACSARVVSLDIKNGGRVVGSLDTGEGVDNIDYSREGKLLYAAAADAAKLTIAQVDDRGRLNPVAIVPTKKGTRSVVAGSAGRAYLIDPFGGNILLVQPVH